MAANVSQISEGKAFKNENLILKLNIIMKTKMSNYRNCFALAYVLLVAVLFSLTSCSEEKYPKYSLTTIEFIPDSLKVEHRKFITETVRAASNQMTGGDYEDVDETIIQAERTADNIFSSSVVGLRKEIDENYWNSLELKPNELNVYEKKILDSLVNSH